MRIFTLIKKYRYLIAEAMEFAKIDEVHMAFQNPD